MKRKLILVIFIFIEALTICSYGINKNPINQEIKKADKSIIGKWVRIGHSGPICFNFKENGIIEADFGNDQTIDVVTRYEISGDTIKFIDKEGKMCQGLGVYKVYQTEYYISFDFIDDQCNGRIKTTMGFWTKPNFKDLLNNLDNEILNSPKPESYLNRARIYLATGNVTLAKSDFDEYILSDSLDASVYLNRAGTRFPFNLSGVVDDCDKAISLDPNNKNAYFLRGLAKYELGQKEQGCDDFTKAIELSFSILRIAEQEKCIEFWKEEQ